MEEATIRKAYAEVYDIIFHMEDEMFDVIPDSFLGMLEDNMDEDYIVHFDYSKDINEQEMLPETRALLALVYRNFICNDEEKKAFDEMQQEKRNEEELEKGKRTCNSLEERFNMLNKNAEGNKSDDTLQIREKSKEDGTISKEQLKEEVNELALTTHSEHRGFFQKIIDFFKKKK